MNDSSAPTESALSRAGAAFGRSVTLMAVFALATNILMLALPLYMLQIYDRVLPSQSRETLLFLSIIAAVSLAVLGLIEGVRSVIANRAAARFDEAVSEPVLAKALQPNANSGANIQPVRDVAAIRNAIASRLVFNLLDLPFALLFVAVLYLIHPDLFWLALGGIVVLVLLALTNEAVTGKISKDQQQADLGATLQLEHYARNADAIAAMGMSADLIDRWGQSHAKALAQADRNAIINARFTGLSRSLRFGLQLAVLGFGAVLVLAGEMTAGMIFASSIIAGRAFQPIDQTISSWRNLASVRQAWDRLKEFMGGEQQETQLVALARPKGNLQVSGIMVPAFDDPAKLPLLGDLSFELDAGQVLAIVGPSGAGKSTLARVLTGILAPATGQVRLDGHALDEWTQTGRGKFIGYLPQSVEMLPGSVGENIARFEEPLDDEAVVAAARLAQVEPLIQKLSGGYNALIGPGGIQLSGGERQRIALARAFYGNPCFVVLDEPNSNLDTEGEAALAAALAKAKQTGMTVVLITQRNNILEQADRIMVLEHGSIRKIGGRDEFRQAVATQGGGRRQVRGAATSRNVTPIRASIERKP